MPKILLLAAAALALASSIGLAKTPAAAAVPKAVTVEIRDMKYEPATLTITAGTMVTWINEDTMPHTVTDRNRMFHSAALDTKDSFSYTFATPGEFTYFCTIHPFMVGKVIVKPAGSPS